ncbi:MAG TPA: guanine deaminase [Candidatus Limnocylindrales bacterium]|nr:guanine deaminase [Candidatus Limnocylindrales bacterium]
MPASPSPTLPDRPPFTVRARILTPLAAGGTGYEADGAVVVDAAGRITSVGPWDPDGTGAAGPASDAVVDLRPWLVLPGLVDLHVHLPQVPHAGLGFGTPLLDWLRRYVFPLEHDFTEAVAEVVAPAVYRAMAAAGTTTALMYGAVYEPSLDAAFRAAEAHGIRAVIGKVMMDRLTYDETLRPSEVLDLSLRQSADLCDRWHMRDRGRLRYAFTPRFAVSCSAEMLRDSAALANETGAYWQTHLAEDAAEIAEVARLFPEARDYLDVYDRAGGLGPRTILAHAIHLSDREIARLAESGSHLAHCPASNLFLSSGIMPLGRYLEAGVSVGLGSDVAGGPDLSLFGAMRVGGYVQNALRVATGDPRPILDPFGWLRLASFEGARALGLEHEIGSLEAGKEADLIAVDPRLAMPPAGPELDDPADILSTLIFRTHPDMVRAAWVRGRQLAGPPG